MVQKIVEGGMKAIKWYFILLLTSLPISNAFASPSSDLASIMQTFQANIGPLYTFIVALAYVMGVWFITDAIFRLKKYGQQRTMMSTHASMAKPVILLILGLALLYFPSFVTVSIQSIWVNSTSSSVLRYPVEPSTWNAFVYPLIDIIRLFGLIAIVRGIIILTRLAGESVQPGSAGKGLMHIIAGTLAVNIVGTIDIIKATFGIG
jgi:intracellular multiplication protein IcmC